MNNARVVLGLVVIFVAIEVLNFTGFCYPEYRYLSEEQFIDIAVRESLKWQSPNSAQNKEYASLADFYAENPKCCGLNRLDPRLEMWSRIFGFYVAVVDVWYRASNTGPEPFLHSEIFISPCGHIRDKRAIPESRPRETTASTRRQL